MRIRRSELQKMLAEIVVGHAGLRNCYPVLSDMGGIALVQDRPSGTSDRMVPHVVGRVHVPYKGKHPVGVRFTPTDEDPGYLTSRFMIGMAARHRDVRAMVYMAGDR